MSKSIPQLNTVSIPAIDGTELFHIVKNNIDYKIDFAQLTRLVRSNLTNTLQTETVYYFKQTVTSAQVLSSNGTPILMIAAPPAGVAISLMTFECAINFNTTPYATNTTLNLYTDTATKVQMEMASILVASVSKIGHGINLVATGATETQLIAAKGIYLKTATGNPTGGDSDITIYGSYRLITL